MTVSAPEAAAEIPEAFDADEPGARRSANEANVRYRWWILMGLVVSAVLEILDTAILNVALPSMAGALGSTVTDAAWVSTAYLLANVVFLPMTAWLSQRFGKKTYLLTSIAVFAVSRLMCAFSSSLGEVIVWRLIQGAAGAALLSTAQAVIVEIFPPDEQGVAQALFGLGLVVSPAAAPLLGGWINDNYCWQVIFYIHVPVALVALLLIGRLYHDPSTRESRESAGMVDIPGVALLAIGLGSLQYVLEEGERHDWFGDIWITRFAVIAVIGILAMVAWELRPSNKKTVVNLRIYSNRGLCAAVVISFVLGIGSYALNLAFTIYIQNVLGFTAIKAGEAMLPVGVGATVSLVIIGAIMNRVNARIPIVSGLLISAFGTWLLGASTADIGLEHTLLPQFLIGFGAGAAVVPINVVAFAALRPSEGSDGAAQLGLGRQLGGSFGIAILNTYVARMMDYHRAMILQRLTLANQAFTSRIYGIARLLMTNGYHGPDARIRAIAIIDRFVAQQSAVKAYNNSFQSVAMLFASCLLLVPLLVVRRATPNITECSTST